MLELSDVTVKYGQHLALDKVSLQIAKGETVVILGANGAGKSSLLKAIAGLVPCAGAAQITLNGQPLRGTAPHLITEAGIALVPEGRGIFGDMTVEENLTLGANPIRARQREAETLALIYDLFPRLQERRKQIARTMSGGEQQMVAIGRALMSNPDFLMLDEPSLGLAPVVIGEMFKALAKIKTTGVGLLMVEQNVKASLKLADRGYLIEAGRMSASAEAATLLNDKEVQSVFLGAVV
ncbi:ABC transporter ATP-binding protein [Cognatishimia sp. SS12]|uniref:ABC transporter ATP-binding protein n=1 Tax=Cognatishimia sp. SS12 TaxID=2979465 RepID=UPI00233089F8|nr:ABC transporter ATP-binding protein [Cognatishimia sp. SS12]MDC0739307.1 ABC transporter ATP-binding protein [Cognatishimia sp. SS12]